MSVNLVRNSAFNFVTQGFVLVLTFVCTPIVVSGLSTEKFGLLTLIWSFVGYFALLDLGISRASTKFVAESIKLNNHNSTKALVWTSITINIITGFVGMILILSTTSYLVNTVFHIAPNLQAMARNTFIVAACGIPFMLVFGTVRGFQMAYQRFDLVNTFQLIIALVQWGGSITLIWMGYGLLEVVYVTVGIRVLCSILSFIMMSRLRTDIFKKVILFDRVEFKKLVSFGGWVTISQIISPLFLYLDRAMIGMFSTLTAVSFYSVPQEAMARMLVIPMSLTTTLFPALSEHAVSQQSDGKSEELYLRSLKYFFILMLPVALIFIVNAEFLLKLWVGAEFAKQSSLVFQILTVGMFLNVLGQIPATALHAYGRPDLTAKFHAFELVLMIGLNVILIPRFGIVGAAITWTVRLVVDSVLLFLTAHKYVGKTFSMIQSHVNMKGVFVQTILIALACTGLLMVENIPVKIIVTCIVCLVFSAGTWFYGIDSYDKKFLLSIPSKILK